MKDIWFISDTHFWHANILKFTGDDGRRIREPFTTLDEMHKTMIWNWNSLVKPQDHVWHLGDVTFRYDGAFTAIMEQLNGHKRLVVGNHDKIKNPNLLRWFDKVALWRGFKEFGFVATHVPILPSANRFGTFNVHGHTHANNLPDQHYINVCVEQTGYAPIHLDQIREEIARRS